MNKNKKNIFFPDKLKRFFVNYFIQVIYLYQYKQFLRSLSITVHHAGEEPNEVLIPSGCCNRSEYGHLRVVCLQR